MAMIPKVNNKGTRDRLDCDPSLTTIASRLQPANLILEEQGDGTRVSVTFKAKGEVGLWAFRVVIHNHFLVHINTGFGECLSIKTHCLRQNPKELASQGH